MRSSTLRVEGDRRIDGTIWGRLTLRLNAA
jgi:hypothetical protein